MKSKTLSELEILKKNSKKLYQDYKNKIIDVILFGSVIKSKFNPNDIDIAILLKSIKESEILNLRKKFDLYYENKKVHLNLIMVETILKNPLFKILLGEGKSLIDNKFLYEKMGYDSGIIFSLNLTALKKNKKVLFSYALHGKNNRKGILDKLKGKEIGRAVFFIPIEFVNEFKEFLDIWDIKYYLIKILKD